MAKQSKRFGQLAGVIPWTARAEYPVGKMRRQRQQQYQHQITVLVLILAITLVAGVIFVVANWREAGSVKTVDCATFPQYCVPFAGGSADYDQLEAAGVRELDLDSEGVAGVVRYVDAGGVPTIGNPDAPVHFRVVSNFTCNHCNSYHSGDLKRFIEDYVLEGKATFGYVLLTGGDPAAERAALAAMCAGEQGAFWEMTDELFRLVRAKGDTSAFSMGTMRDSADEMNLDKNKLAECVTDGNYMALLQNNVTFAADNGVTGTPTVFVSYGDSDEWTAVTRSYDSLAEITNAASASPE